MYVERLKPIVVIPIQSGTGDSSRKLDSLGVAGVVPQIAIETHFDHNSGVGKVSQQSKPAKFVRVAYSDGTVETTAKLAYVPPIGRGLETRLGVSNRAACVEKQAEGLREAIAKLAIRKSHIPRKIAGKPIDSTPYDPKEGDKKKDQFADQALWTVQEAIRELALEGNRREATQYALSAIDAREDWRVAILCCLDFWFGGRRKTPIAYDMRDRGQRED